MITKLLVTSALLVGATLTINGVAVNANDLLASASSAVGYANISQFRTALDLYYLDNGSYPNVATGAEMIKALEDGNYVRENAPINTDQFNYQVKDNGQNYSLELNTI